jgi:hypothetical protein
MYELASYVNAKAAVVSGGQPGGRAQRVCSQAARSGSPRSLALTA